MCSGWKRPAGESLGRANAVLAGALGVCLCLGFIGAAMWFQANGVYPASDAPGLSLYYASFGVAGFVFGVIMVAGLFGRNSL